VDGRQPFSSGYSGTTEQCSWICEGAILYLAERQRENPQAIKLTGILANSAEGNYPSTGWLSNKQFPSAKRSSVIHIGKVSLMEHFNRTRNRQTTFLATLCLCHCLWLIGLQFSHARIAAIVTTKVFSGGRCDKNRLISPRFHISRPDIPFIRDTCDDIRSGRVHREEVDAMVRIERVPGKN
jgi:hypothetical protein